MSATRDKLQIYHAACPLICYMANTKLLRILTQLGITLVNSTFIELGIKSKLHKLVKLVADDGQLWLNVAIHTILFYN